MTGIIWAADHGANVINLSIVGSAPSSAMQQAVQYAVDRGVSVVIAAGNSGGSGNPVVYPAFDSTVIPGAMAVGATQENDTIAPFSSYGSYINLAAPGVGITSTWGASDDQYTTGSGTSYSTPYVAASWSDPSCRVSC